MADSNKMEQAHVLIGLAREIVSDKAKASVMHRERFDELLLVANSLLDAEERLEVYQKKIEEGLI